MATTNEQPVTFRFSNESAPPRDRFPLWYEVFGRSVTRRLLHMLAPEAEEPCRVQMTVHSLARGTGAGACVQRMALTGGVSARRTPELLADGNDDVVLHIQETGRRVVSQLGHEEEATAGGGLLSSNADPSTVILPEPTRFASIGLPRKLMSALVPGLEDTLVRPLPPGAPALGLLRRYLTVLDDEAALQSPELQRAVAAHIHDLCALAIGAGRDTAEAARGRGVRAARLHAIKADIAENLADDDLSAATLARRQGVTSRYVHKLFELEGTTISHYVLGRRLAQVHRTLSDTRNAVLTIAEVAYGAGFGDLSTFNRAFRRHFGATPSDVRAAASNEAH
jgi:AraC-like DNA-binding protein